MAHIDTKTFQSSQEPAALDTLTRAEVSEAVDQGLTSDVSVRKLLQATSEVGCSIDRSFFHVLRCSAAVGGGFAPEHGVILCNNRLHTRREVWNAMKHELIHAYDHCRSGGRIGSSASVRIPGSGGGPDAPLTSANDEGEKDRRTGVNRSRSGSPAAAAATDAGIADGAVKRTSTLDSDRESCNGGSSSSSSDSTSNSSSEGQQHVDAARVAARFGGLDWSNCHHHACTEIRAANLSGDCSLLQELLRGNLPLLPLGWAAQQRACVARRAALSVAMNPTCDGPDAAAAVVEEMMPACLADTAPFDPSEAVAGPS
ncbi:hypothetical protein VaNZ11_013163 [Volvox africanus]|uniref:Mitochondrial inner membrane protease ATP23 n=1 Tax=Volvox africanus TaxID=51714 RepID=A0ABQ5SH81_9CHLO|nr:hypothetical protein VaNZ11_013163 [Volvox africanus]